jgi:hypothetical protein
VIARVENKIEPTNKISTKNISDDEPCRNESFDDTIMDDSQISMDVGDFENAPSIRAETVTRGFTHKRMSNSTNLEEFMDEQLQVVAIKLSDKKCLEKYNMALRMNMKQHINDIQEMLDDSNSIQKQLNRERAKLTSNENEVGDIDLELNELRLRIDDIRQKWSWDIEVLDQYKTDLYYKLADERDAFQMKSEEDK